MGIKIERVPVKAREGVMERPDGERIPFRTEEGSKVGNAVPSKLANIFALEIKKYL